MRNPLSKGILLLQLIMVAVGCGAPQSTRDVPTAAPIASPTPTVDPLTLLRTQTARTAAPAVQNTSALVLTAAPPLPQLGTTPSQAAMPGIGKIAFMSNRDRIPEGMPAANSQHPAEIYVMDGNGNNQRRVTVGQGWSGGSLQWYADGQKLFVTGAVSRTLTIEVATGRIVEESNWEYAPVRSPDGSRIAHQQAFCFPPPYTDCSLQLFVLDLKTGQDRRVTFADIGSGKVVHDQSPNWSSSGREIAFARIRPIRPNSPDNGIYVMNGDGSGVRQLNRQWVYSAAWSPDGRKIAFVSAHSFDAEGNPSSGTDIWIMDVESKKQFNLTNSEEVIEYAPSWSPDGKQIVFQAAASGEAYQIFIINTDGTGLKQLTTRGRNSSPSWGP